MDNLDEFLGWSKMVLSERDDGAHEWLHAIYRCLTRSEAITLEVSKMPTYLRRGTEVLTRRETSVYGAQNGCMFVVFDWRVTEPFQPIDTFSES